MSVSCMHDNYQYMSDDPVLFQNIWWFCIHLVNYLNKFNIIYTFSFIFIKGITILCQDTFFETSQYKGKDIDNIKIGY